MALALVLAGSSAVSAAVEASDMGASDKPSLAILRRPYTASDQVGQALQRDIHIRVKPGTSRLAWSRYGVRYYVIARPHGGVCLVQARIRSGQVARASGTCNALATITKYGAITMATIRVEGATATWAGIVADGYTRASLGGHVGHVRNNVFHLRTQRLHGVLHVEGPGVETRDIPLH